MHALAASRRKQALNPPRTGAKRGLQRAKPGRCAVALRSEGQEPLYLPLSAAVGVEGAKNGEGPCG